MNFEISYLNESEHCKKKTTEGPYLETVLQFTLLDHVLDKDCDLWGIDKSTMYLQHNSNSTLEELPIQYRDLAQTLLALCSVTSVYFSAEQNMIVLKKRHAASWEELQHEASLILLRFKI